MVTWDELTDAPLHVRVAFLRASPTVIDAVARSVANVRHVLAAGGADSSDLMDVESAVNLFAVVLAPLTVRMLEAGAEVRCRTTGSTWSSLGAQRGLTFAAMWDSVRAAIEERGSAGELSWLDEFVLDGSCRGWTVTPPEEPTGPDVAQPVARTARAIRAWLVASYDPFVQGVLCRDYARRVWWREYELPSDASADFWGFYAVARWDYHSVLRSRFLGLSSLRAYLFSQLRAFAKEKERARAGLALIPGTESADGEGVQSQAQVHAEPTIAAAASTSYFLTMARDCIDRHKDRFGDEVRVWVESNLAMCQSSYLDFAGAMSRIPADLRHGRQTAYNRYGAFREAVKHCVEHAPLGPGDYLDTHRPMPHEPPRVRAKGVAQ